MDKTKELYALRSAYLLNPSREAQEIVNLVDQLLELIPDTDEYISFYSKEMDARVGVDEFGLYQIGEDGLRHDAPIDFVLKVAKEALDEASRPPVDDNQIVTDIKTKLEKDLTQLSLNSQEAKRLLDYIDRIRTELHHWRTSRGLSSFQEDNYSEGYLKGFSDAKRIKP